MEIIRIFVKKNFEGLYSIQYKNQNICEFQKLFEIWHDYHYLLNFCKENERDIFTPFWGISKLEEFVEMVIDEVYELESIFEEYRKHGIYDGSIKLSDIFRPLNDLESSFPVLQEMKGKVDYHGHFKKPKLRLYALRVNENTFILTGGCIKTTHRMDENNYTLLELKKIKTVRDYLRAEGYTTLDDLIYYYE